MYIIKSLKFNFFNILLVLESNGEEVEVKKDLATLSGGEKSYLQMCLILSMWDSIISPIRFCFNTGLTFTNMRMDAKMCSTTCIERG